VKVAPLATTFPAKDAVQNAIASTADKITLFMALKN
jgi:hypothetical protein